MHNIPKNVRINMSSKSEIPAFGEYVKIRANLIPIPKQAFHGAYNIERVLYVPYMFYPIQMRNL